MSDAAVGNLRKIVRRQPVILITDKSLEKMPGLARDPAERSPFILAERQVADLLGTADPERHDRREEPTGQKGARGPKRRWPQERHHRGAYRGQGERSPHSGQEIAQP